jgi:hypothetical protein
LKAEYLPSFLKDLKRLRGSEAFTRIKAFAFEEIAAAPDLRSISGVRALHRREIYRQFP